MLRNDGERLREAIAEMADAAAERNEGVWSVTLDAFCERLFPDLLQGHALLSNASHLRGSAQWIRFPRVICERWVHRVGPRNVPVVLMGDAAHTAHFSIGSGTKLALEDAIELARTIGSHRGDLAAARIMGL
jgi:anthraniloyl-CoA monooxygenase